MAFLLSSKIMGVSIIVGADSHPIRLIKTKKNMAAEGFLIMLIVVA
jgi:hypothetical protein